MHYRGETRHINHKVQSAVSLETVPNYMCVTCNVIDINILCMIQEELYTMSTKGKHLCRYFCQVHSLLYTILGPTHVLPRHRRKLFTFL
jgi:hypothetical protein